MEINYLSEFLDFINNLPTDFIVTNVNDVKITDKVDFLINDSDKSMKLSELKEKLSNIVISNKNLITNMQSAELICEGSSCPKLLIKTK